MIGTFIQQTLHDMWTHKLRSFLALFGIIWGTLTVVLLLALGHGFHQASQKNMMQIVDGTFFAFPARTSLSYRGFPEGQPINMKASNIIALQKAIPDIIAVSPMLRTQQFISYKKNQVSQYVFGVSPAFGYLRKINLMPGGRFINQSDIQHNARVAIIGNKLKVRLFGDAPALNQKIGINHVTFTVVGIVQESSKNVYNWYDNKAIIPYTTHINLFGNQNIHRFIVLPDPNADSKLVAQAMRSYFAYKYHFDPNDTSAIRVFDTTKIFQFFKWFFIGIQIFLGSCGFLTLAVGSLGVTNIMFLIVTERTREIGLRMATGARDWHIMLQIILEALTIIGLGGFIGFSIAYLTTKILLLFKLPDWLGKPSISLESVLVTISILAILGVCASYFPARRAANMDPVEAINF